MLRTMDAPKKPTAEPAYKCLIIGAGMSGLCMAIQLRKAGIGPLVLIEKSNDVGGTWLDNHYPNSGCDIPSFLYSYSFAPRFDWTMKYARQPEILQYFRDCADQFGIRENIRFGESVQSAAFDSERQCWEVLLKSGKTLSAQFLISAVGQLNVPRIPEFPGADSFQGDSWHSARWNQQSCLAGKRVAVIGNGASTIQFIRSVAEASQQVYLFQRSPSWIHPLYNTRYSGCTKWCFRNIPLAARLHRLLIFAACEYRVIAMKKIGLAHHIYRWWLERNMRGKLSTAMQKTMIPDYPPGCKRILLSSDFLETVQRDNVEVITEPIDRFEVDGIVAGGRRLQVDSVIYGTGFDSTDFLRTVQISGLAGRTLHDEWNQQPRCLYGMTTRGFPNLFVLYGPNTNLGHNSIIYMVESQVNYIIQCMRWMQLNGKRTIQASEQALQQYNNRLQSQLQDSVWAADCSSWYKKSDGTISNNWSGAALSYRRLTRRPRMTEFEFT